MLNQLQKINTTKNIWDSKMNIVDATKKAIIDRLQNRLKEATQDIIDVSKTTSNLFKTLSNPIQVDSTLQNTLQDSLNHLTSTRSTIQAQKTDIESHIVAYDDGNWNFSDNIIKTEIQNQQTHIDSITRANNTLIDNYNNNSWNKKWNPPKPDFSAIKPFAEKIAELNNSILTEKQNFQQGKEYIDYVNRNIKFIDKAISELKTIQSWISQFEWSPTSNRIEINTDDNNSTINLEKGIKGWFSLSNKELEISDTTGSINAQYPDPNINNARRIRTNATLKDGSNKDVVVTITATDKNNLSNINLSDIKVFDPSIRDINWKLQELSKDSYPIDFWFNISTNADIAIGSKKLKLENTCTIPLRLTCESLEKNGQKSAIHNELSDTWVNSKTNKNTFSNLNNLISRSIKADETTSDHIKSATDRYFKDINWNSIERKWLFEKKSLTGFITQNLQDEWWNNWLIDRIILLINQSDFKKNPILYSNTETTHTLDNWLSHMGNKLPGYTWWWVSTFRQKFAEYIDDLNNWTHISDPIWTAFFTNDAIRDTILTWLASSNDTFQLKRSRDNNTTSKSFLDHYYDFTNYVNSDYPKIENLHDNITISDAYSEYLAKLSNPLTTSISWTLADGKSYTMNLTSAYDKTSKTYNAKIEVLIDKNIVWTPSPYEIKNVHHYKDIMRGIYDFCDDIEDKRSDKSLKSYAGHFNSIGMQLCINTIADCIDVWQSKQPFSNASNTINWDIQLLKKASNPNEMELNISGTHTFNTSNNKKISTSEIKWAIQSLDVLLATRRLAQREAIEWTNNVKPMLIPDAMKNNITPITENYSIFVNKYGEGIWIRKIEGSDEYECRDTRKRPAIRWPFRTGEWMEGWKNIADSHNEAMWTHQPLIQQGKNTRDHWVYDFRELGQSFVDGFKSVKALAYKAPINTLKSIKSSLSWNKKPSTIAGVEEQVNSIASLWNLHDDKNVRYEYINAISSDLKENMTNLYLNNNERKIWKFVYDLRGLVLKSHGNEWLMKKKIKNMLSERTGYNDIDTKTDELYNILTDSNNDPEYISAQLQEIVINGITSSSDCKDFVQSKSNTIANLLRTTKDKKEKRISKLRWIFNMMFTKNTRWKWAGYAWSFLWLQTINIISTAKAVTETGKLAWRGIDTTYRHSKTLLKTTGQLVEWWRNLTGSKTIWRGNANEKYTISKLLQTMPIEAKDEFESMNIHSAPDREYHILQQWFNKQRSYLTDQREDSTQNLNKELYYSWDIEHLHEWGIAITVPIQGRNTTFAIQRDTSGAMLLHRLDTTNIDTFQNSKNKNSQYHNSLKSFIRNLKVNEPDLYSWTDGDQTTTKNVEKSRDKQIENLQNISNIWKCKISEAVLNQQDYEKKTHNPSIIESTLRIDMDWTLSGDQDFIDLYKNDRRIISWMSEAINYFYPANTNRDILNTFKKWERADSTLTNVTSTIVKTVKKNPFKFWKFWKKL